MALTLADRLLADGFILDRRAVGYGRISDDADEQVNSLLNQIDFFDDFFEETALKKVLEIGMYHKRDGTKKMLPGVYADEGISGTSLRRREAFKQMIADAKRGLFDVIVVKSIARWARDVENGYPIIKDLAAIGVAVYFYDNSCSSLDPTADNKIVTGLANAQDESRSKSRHTQFGLKRVQKKGKWTTRPPFGYIMANGFLQPYLYELCVMMDIGYLFYNESFGGSRISQYLEDAGVRTKGGKVTWTNPVILNMISNPIYAGLQVQHQTQMLDVNRGRKIDIDSNQWIVIYNPELAIFSFEHWNLLQLEKHRRSSSSEYLQIYEEDGKRMIKVIKGKSEEERTRHSSKHLFSNLIYCGNCGSLHHRQKRHTKRLAYKWRCRHNGMLGKKRGCKHSNSVNEDDLLEYVKQEVHTFRTAKKDREWYLEAFLKTNFKQIDHSRLVELDEQFEQVEKRLNDTLDLLSDGRIPKETLHKRIGALTSELETNQEEQRGIRHREQNIQKIRLKFDEFIKFLDSVYLDDLNNGTIRRIIDRITITTDEKKLKRGEEARDIVITWKFFDKTEDDIWWEYSSVEHEEWKRNVWYSGMTDEEVQEEEERLAEQEEFLKTPEGQQYLNEQEELRREIFEAEHPNWTLKS